MAARTLVREVSVNAAEIQGEPALSAESVRARCAPLVGIEAPARMGAKLPCPVLVDNACAAYV